MGAIKEITEHVPKQSLPAPPPPAIFCNRRACECEWVVGVGVVALMGARAPVAVISEMRRWGELMRDP